MFRKATIVSGGLLCVFWGISHLVPTSSVVRGFGGISKDNTNIIRMEWINEGLTLLFIGALVILVALAAGENNGTTRVAHTAAAVMLFAMAVLSLFTGFNIDFLPFKLCPVIFSISAALILAGAYRKA